MEGSPAANREMSRAGYNKVSEWIAGCEAVRSGLFEAFFIEVSEDHSGVMIDLENVDEAEARIRDSFREMYPDLFPINEDDRQLQASHARRTSDIYVYPSMHASESYDPQALLN